MKDYIFKFKKDLFLTTIFKIIASFLWVNIALVIKEITDTAISGTKDSFIKVAFFSIFYFILFAFIFFISNFFKTYYIKNTLIYLKNAIYKGIINKPYYEFTKKDSTEYLSNLTNDITLFEKNYLNPLIELFGETLTFIITIFTLIKINIPITILLILTGFLMLIIPLLFDKPISNKQNSLSNNLSLFTGKLKDLLSGYEIIHSYSIENKTIEDVSVSNVNLETSRQTFDIFVFFTQTISLILSLACQFSGIILGGFLVISGELSIGILMAIMQLSNGVFGPIQKMVQYLTLIKGSKDLNNRLKSLTLYKDKVSSKMEFSKSITLKNIYFSYSTNRLILNNLSLKLEKNKKYALLGESGCGKSTLIKLLLNYYQSYSGSISMDNKNLKTSDKSLNNLTSVIHQNIYIFNTTISENITLGKDYSKEALTQVLKLSGVTNFLNSEITLNSIVGEGGSNLSGGQKQRIAIARALIQSKPILILDEATSALDAKTSMEIENIILNIPNITLLTITHNLKENLLRKYDHILIMSSGKIIDSGSYDELKISNDFFIKCIKTGI